MYAGFESPIPANNNTKGAEKPKTEEKKTAASADAKPSVVTGKPARFVRIEIPAEKACLQIAEIEIMSGGKNIAKDGKATQSTTANGGDSIRALDGDKSPDWGKGMTHTKEGQPNPWWEVDLGAAHEVDTIGLWSRAGFSDRLGGFTLQLLDDSRKAVFEVKNVAGPEELTIDVKGGGKLTYLTFDGKPGKPVVKGSGGGAPAAKEPALVEVLHDVLEHLRELVLLKRARREAFGGGRSLDRAERLDDEERVLRDDGATRLRDDVRMRNALFVADVGDVADDVAGVLLEGVVHRPVGGRA
jgi:hypothetical protein